MTGFRIFTLYFSFASREKKNRRRRYASGSVPSSDVLPLSYRTCSRATAESLASSRTSGAIPPVEIDFIGGIHGHSGSNQARRKETRNAVRQDTAPVESSPSGCKSSGRFDEPRTNTRKEARVVRRWESENCPGGEKAMGEGSSPREESSKMRSHR